MVDHFAYFQYAYISTSKSQEATDFIKLVNNVIENNDINMLLCDQYSGLNSNEFREFLESKNITLVYTAVNTPSSNGLNERLNQTLVNKIRCKINEQGKNLAWTTIAHECTKRYNETEHTITGFSPKYLLEGTSIEDVPLELKENWLKNNLFEDRKKALENTIKSHKYNKQRFDKLRTNYILNGGDLVYVENGNRLNRKKLDEIRIGPYRIVKKLSDCIYRLDTGHRNWETTHYHISKLVPITNAP